EDQLFYSRRIGLYEGEIIPIIGGARLVGRARKWDMGFLDMQTASYDFFDSDTDSLIHLASANHGVFRARKQVFNPTSYAGGMITSRIDASGNYNINAAADLIFNPFRNDYITANYIHTFDNTLAETDQFFNQGKFYLNWLNRSNIGLTYEFSISRAGENFLPEMGFELLENYSRLHGSVGYGWVFNDEDKKMLNQQLFFWTWINKRNTDMVTDISETSLGYNFSMKNGFRANVDIFHNHEFLQEQFDIADDMYFPAGFYDFYRVQGGIGTTSSRPVVLNVKSRFGTYYDGWLTILGPVEVNFKFSPSFNLGLYYQYNIADVTVREQYFRSHLARLKTEFTFTTRLSLLMFFQYSSDDRFGINNIRFRYNPREGNDFYFVYNGDYNTHLTREVPELPLMNRNSFYIKYTYTFIWDK
ncbi:MAG TPA: hypothetical protein VI583_07690, partial [Cyclobacteriaceae bacterium]|nr:hypothetical protein [Cyclobacteriaceae bacterium]